MATKHDNQIQTAIGNGSSKLISMKIFISDVSKYIWLTFTRLHERRGLIMSSEWVKYGDPARPKSNNYYNKTGKSDRITKLEKNVSLAVEGSDKL